MNTRPVIFTALIICLVAAFVSAGMDDDKKDIKITVRASAERGHAPLPVTFIAEIDADTALDKYLYESSTEWIIEGNFRLSSKFTGGNPVSDPNMRGSAPTMAEHMLYSDKHLVAKSRQRAPRKRYEEGMEIKRTFEFTHEFDKPGNYFIRFRLRNGKFSSKVVKVVIRGEDPYDPIRDPY